MPKLSFRKKILHKQVKPSPDIMSEDIIRYGVKNERSARLIEKDNTLTFVVHSKATKPMIKKAFIEIYDSPVMKVNTVNTIKGYKKAYIRLKNEGAAMDVAEKAGIV
ncbi:50S ribosomal protein L23 [Dictyocoela muelleri]|nr:50S ribosomal protein L23 [Dictyocoela muelleri]